jgi:class 3 adenylate cyclase
MDERDQLRRAIAYLETQRPQLGDAVVDVSTAALRGQLAKPAVSARPDKEHRLVTVLFADMVGWSHLAATLDPEHLQATQRTFFATVTPPLETHGGSLEDHP